MAETNLIELARRGDSGAIATLLNRFFQPQGITVSADWQNSQLNLRFTAANAFDAASVIAFVQKYIERWQVESEVTVKLFGYQSSSPKPIWAKVLGLTESVSQNSAADHSLFGVVEAVTEESTAVTDGITTKSTTTGTAEEIPVENMDLVDRFIVCGLGSLGQYCVLNLKRFALKAFEIHVTAIDKANPEEWEVHDLPNLLDGELILGDCRDTDILLRAGIENCRAVLLVTDNDSVNVETAIVARRLNPKVRLIVRSSRQSLNQLLRQQLGNFVAFEPTELPATAFALAGLGAGILGYFNIGDCQLQVVEQQVQPRDFRFDNIPAMLLYKRTYRLLSHRAAEAASTPINPSEHTFHQWQPDTKVQAGDTIAYIEVVGKTAERLNLGGFARNFQKTAQEQVSLPQRIQTLFQSSLGQRTGDFWRWMRAQRSRQAVGIGLVIALSLWLLEVILLMATLKLSLMKAVSNATILLLGGYGDLFGGFEPDKIPIPVWLNLFSLFVTIISFLFILGVFGLIADSLLTSRFDFLRRRPPIPKQNHVIVVGFGRVGQRVAALLKEFRQPVVAITEQLDNANLLAQIPLVIGSFITELSRVNLATAKSIMVLTEDQMLNLEVALMAKDAARQMNRDIGLVIRTYNQRFSDNLHQLLPDAKALAAYALSAEAFAGAAFGENILGLFRLNNRTILVTEYNITANDTLVDKLLSEVAYGYGVVPIFHRKSTQSYLNEIAEFLMPSDDVKLQVGDRLIVLASLNGLRRIEHGAMLPRRRWLLKAQKPLSSASLLDASSALHRISGYHLDAARAFMKHLPQEIELLLYDHQAYRLERKLNSHLPVKLVPITQTKQP